MADIHGLMNDPQFQSLDIAAQKATLAQIDPAFSGLSDDDLQTFKQHFTAPAAPPENPVWSALKGVAHIALGFPGTINDMARQQASQMVMPSYTPVPDFNGGRVNVTLPVQTPNDLADTLNTDTLASLAGAGGEAMPSFKRAAANIQRVTDAVGTQPIALSGDLSQTALRMKDLASRGNRLPKVVNDFIQRATAPRRPPMTFSEARDFYSSASRLSGDELNKMTATMKSALGSFVRALHGSLVDAADSQGLGSTYDSAIQEYRNAAKVQDFTSTVKEAVKKRALPAAATGLGAAGAYSLYRDLTR